jgi:hypothetical protein
MKVIDHLLSSLDIHPILLDIGASGAPPEIWKQIASQSIYVGFDPDEREIRELKESGFFKAMIVNKAVTSQRACDELEFYLTKSPYCSSALNPDQASLSQYLFHDLFTVERRVQVPAMSLEKIMDSLSLPGVDWFKTDSQGTDLRLFTSLETSVRSRVLAVDVEPGLIDAYVGEDLFVDVHRELTQNGFWLSRLDICGTVRIRKSSLIAVTALDKQVDADFVAKAVRPSPGWGEARYLRTIDWLVRRNASQRDFVLLWIFALLDGQFGFAFDLGLEHERAFGTGELTQVMKDEPVALMKQTYRGQYWAPSRFSAKVVRGFRKLWTSWRH